MKVPWDKTGGEQGAGNGSRDRGWKYRPER